MDTAVSGRRRPDVGGSRAWPIRSFLTSISRSAIGLGVHNRFDQLTKRLARGGFASSGRVETDAEVSPDALRIDVWWQPHPRRGREALNRLGLLGRMGRRSCTLESFHCTPSGGLVVDCIVKHWLFCRELDRRKPRPPRPSQWIISSGRASAALRGLGFRKSRWGPGIYDGPALMRTRLVVVRELPRTRDTVLVRMMGAGKTLKLAIADIQALPPDAPERLLALPILVELRLEILKDPAKQTESDQEFLMSTREVEKYLEQIEQRGLEVGLKEGLERGFARAVLAAYRARFGAPPAALGTAVEQAHDHAELERWLEIVTTRSKEEIAAALRRPRTAKSSVRARGSASTRRAPAPR